MNEKLVQSPREGLETRSILLWQQDKNAINGVDPDNLLQNVVSHQDLHCLIEEN